VNTVEDACEGTRRRGRRARLRCCKLQEQKEAVAGQPPAPDDEPAIDVKNLSKVAYTWAARSFTRNSSTHQMAAVGRVNSAANSLIPSGRMGFARKWSKPASIPMTRSAGDALPDIITVDARCCRGCFLICVQTS
jgi:hypothetical protein